MRFRPAQSADAEFYAAFLGVAADWLRQGAEASPELSQRVRQLDQMRRELIRGRLPLPKSVRLLIQRLRVTPRRRKGSR